HPTEHLYQCWDNGNPYTVLPSILKYWASSPNTQPNFWEAPSGLYWISGQKAYSKLPPEWHGSCTLGAIQPNFFLLSEDTENHLGVPI
ncbi:ENR1 protein, partial [Falcunculus frontatus]|nr:ENR1 protein [Falcunculus frontatus]